MGGDTRFGSVRRSTSRRFIFAFACIALLAGGCNESSAPAGKSVV